MAWLEKLNLAINVKTEGVMAQYPFEEGRTYWQLDLDGRDAVEGLASFYLHDGNPGFFGECIIEQLEKQRVADLGSVAIYTRSSGLSEIAYAFIADNSDFVPRLP